ncbi:hypothetical protein [Parasitella parasitica]|uniref:Uncharacterized protein n=1 Tax=Parasitella parasitica TaxID=35722 RepID=A0A0B7NDH0_9FUNG|nr:hypothetical protein [Parasitella parasitica]
MEKPVIYRPEDNGGLSAIDIYAQQKVLQQRHVKSLLLDNPLESPIPAYFLELLTSYIQLNFGTSYS